MLESTLVEIIYTSGGAISALIVIALVLRKIWTLFGEEKLKTTKTGAEISLFENMQADIERLRNEISAIRENYQEEISNLKLEHVQEREELVQRIAHLEKTLDKIQYVNSNIKEDAITLLNKIEDRDTDMDDDLKELLSRIINEIDKRNQVNKYYTV